ncbi:hypothetical protein V8E52_000346 [Russula decolorans]
MGFVRFDDLSRVNGTSPVATSTKVESLSSPSSPSTEFSLLASSSTKPDPTLSFTHPHHHIFYTHSFTRSFFDPPSSVPPTGLTSPHNSPDRVIPSQHIHKNLVIIIIAAIGGAIALIFLALFTRQAMAYTRLPRQNMALTAAEREELAQEMAGYAEMADRRRRLFLSPPPPYERAPPYEFSPHQPQCNTNDSC